MNSLHRVKEHPKISNFLQFESQSSKRFKVKAISDLRDLYGKRSKASSASILISVICMIDSWGENLISFKRRRKNWYFCTVSMLYLDILKSVKRVRHESEAGEALDLISLREVLVLGCSFTWCKLFILFMIVYDKNKDASLWIGSIRCSYFDSLLNFRHFYCFILTRHIWYCYSNNYQVQSEFVDLSSQSASKKQSRKKAHKPLRTSCIYQNMSAMFDNHTILLFWP